jgi:D-alanyl-D-alanine carboxypeptidase
VRLYAIVLGAPNEPARNRDVARLLDWGFNRFERASLVRAGQAFGHAGTIRLVAARGLSAVLDPGEQVRERVVLPRRLNRPVRRGERVGTVELRSSRGLLGRVPLVADRAGGGHPALVPWLRSLHLPFSL